MKQKQEKIKNRKHSKIGGYSLVLCALMLVFVIALNILVGVLPTTITKKDITEKSYYTISDQTRSIATGMKEDVTFYVIAQSGNEKEMTVELLKRYAALSNHIKIQYVDPVLDPEFVSKYTDEEIVENSVIVESAQRYRVLPYDKLYETIYGQDSMQYYIADIVFHGENLFTGAINYVTSDYVPKLYLLEGHKEQATSQTYLDSIQAENFEISSLNLMSKATVPEDCDLLFINTPEKDITEEESAAIIDYLEKGGKMALVTNYIKDGMPNLMKVMEYYGVTAVNGIVIEKDGNHYMQNDYDLLPIEMSHDITLPLINKNMMVRMPIAHGIKEVETAVRSTVVVEPLLKTSEESYAKMKGYDAANSAKAEGDPDGPFYTAVAITEEFNDVKTQIVWFSCGNFVNDTADQSVSGANSDLLLNALAWLQGKDDSISIRGKSTIPAALSVTANETRIWIIVLDIAIPVLVLVIGFGIWLRRRKR